jgi:EAL domain-containing protein (putative c-di-GMP-specific phosphodiesterase class I)
VTAEGVETPVQADRLRLIGCDTGQGWHFGRPGPVTQRIRREVVASP